ncbi:hypothetical protein AVDCRST_MAG82-1046, partial [uncultured Rubrobacteraceae bacterium]
ARRASRSAPHALRGRFLRACGRCEYPRRPRLPGRLGEQADQCGRPARAGPGYNSKRHVVLL